jgi:hypothetical protein
MAKSIEDVLWDMVDLCHHHQLSYAVMGGVAVRIHGIPRPTFDVEIELSVDEEQLALFFDDVMTKGYAVAAPFRSGWRDEVGGMPVVKLATDVVGRRAIDVDVFLNETPFQQSVMDRRREFDIVDSGKERSGGVSRGPCPSQAARQSPARFWAMSATSCSSRGSSTKRTCENGQNA